MATASPPKPKPKSTIKDLFFLKRRPRLRNVPMDWDPPTDAAAYQKLLNDEGFVTNEYWKDDDISNHPIINQDLADLDEYLLPTFFEFSQKSKYFQNQFYLFQWVFIWGAFLTTILGALASIFYLASPGPVVNTGLSVQQFFSYLTAFVGAVTAFITALSNRGEPLKRWGKTRRLAEELRMNYFNYLSHLTPYEKPDRVQKLREMVIDIRVKEQENA